MSSSKLSLEFIRSLGLEEKSDHIKTTVAGFDIDCVKSCWTLDNGVELQATIENEGKSCKVDVLYGFDGCLFVKTEQELKDLMDKSYEDVLHDLDDTNPFFDLEDYM